MANNRLDIVIFGATGYTGKFVVKNIIQICKEQKMKFGIAGRKKESLEAVAKECALDIEDKYIILADIKDEESLKKMTEQAKVLISCVGPYRFYGEPVIKACLATRTHYVDFTGEEEFMAKMQLEYNEAAKKAGIYVVSACGFDCIPSDLGVIFTQQKFGGEVNAIEAYGEVSAPSSKGPYLNYGTWESLIHSVTNITEKRKVHKKLFPTKLPEFTPKLKSRGLVHRSDVVEGWSIPFQGADRSLILRTQRFLYNEYNERPSQIQVYLTFKSLFNCLLMIIASIIILLMTRITWGRNLLLKYPSLFSFGYMSHENPDPEIWNSVGFSFTFKARGWTEKLAEPTDKHTNPPNKVVITKVSGSSLAYELTSIATILSAITILNEADKMPNNGGVFTPGGAFSKTSLIEQLQNKSSLKFEVISSTEK